LDLQIARRLGLLVRQDPRLRLRHRARRADRAKRGILATLARPGLTLEGLDAISGSIDALTFSLDDVATSALAQLSIVDSSHKLGFFGGPVAGGPALEATLDPAEQSLERRMRVKGFRPLTDAPACYGSIGARENLQGSVTYSSEQAVNGKGLCPA